ncbi:indolethylamine N-methyltransferase [Megalops cyprinoides]|uniref:indolethylamine N-methyltransferase n=1 Tax=Megalops cyprinoides TaxID=118141 RepID=UPI001863D998|nr:indolethylamine N-methyltransferase [Megalops cyprinoides]
MEESAHIIFTEGEFYQSHFDARAYFDSFYASPQGHPDEDYLPFELHQLSKTFSAGNLRGQRLIEVGTGPTIHSLISACEYFEEIVVSDFADSNRREIEKWLRQEEGCLDWNAIIQFVCELEGKRTPDEVAQRLRRTVKQVLRCDVRLENPFHPVTFEPADCVMTSLCLEAACKDLDTYRRAVQSLAALVKPGGALVITGVLEETFYMVGQQRFSCLKLSQSFIEKTLRDLGFSIQQFNTLPAKHDGVNEVSDFDAIFHLVAQKSI